MKGLILAILAVAAPAFGQVSAPSSIQVSNIAPVVIANGTPAMKFAWDMKSASTSTDWDANAAQLASYTYRLFMDGAEGAALAGVSCAGAAGAQNYTCSCPIPKTIANGYHSALINVSDGTQTSPMSTPPFDFLMSGSTVVAQTPPAPGNVVVSNAP